MSALFAKIIKQALITFDQNNISSFANNLKILKQLVNGLTVPDLNLNPGLLTEDVFNRPEKAPCTYIHILQTVDVSMSIFILRKNYTMPLHDHPMMHGILKCISGTLLIQSYTKRLNKTDELPYVPDAKEINVIREPRNIINNSSECAILTPKERNFHEITALDGVAAFFDILAPPYESNIPIYGRRKCNFYRKIESEQNPIECTLIRIPSPLSYYCDNVEYKAPSFLYEIIYQHATSNENSK